MENFAANLTDRVQTRLYEIRTSQAAKHQKSWEAVCFLEQQVALLKEFTLDYVFRDEAEEILFFKQTKPKLVSWLVYSYEVYLLEIGKPIGSDQAVKDYLESGLNSLNDFFIRYADFYRYYRSGSTYMDGQFFVRGVPCDAERIYFERNWYERDPRFSTGGDLMVTRLLANEFLQNYIKGELRRIEQPDIVCPGLPDKWPVWTGRKTELIEQLYAWDADGCFNNGEVSLAQLTAFVEKVFGIELGNVPRNFYDMKIRNTPTPFLDRLKNRLLERMGRK